jgi:hypothetical protein
MIAKAPPLKDSIAQLLRSGYCRSCIKQRLRLPGSSANEMDTIARTTPRGLVGRCVGCQADRGGRDA